MRASLALRDGLIKTKAKAKDGKTRDGEDIKKNALFEPDNVELVVAAVTMDQAGNPSGKVDEAVTKVHCRYQEAGNFGSASCCW